jgi:hypothetical protein
VAPESANLGGLSVCRAIRIRYKETSLRDSVYEEGKIGGVSRRSNHAGRCLVVSISQLRVRMLLYRKPVLRYIILQ